MLVFVGALVFAGEVLKPLAALVARAARRC
jgi:hypothetical protein